jgi:transposase-like protein
MERRKFTREFKLEAVRLIKDRGVSYVQASEDLGVHPSQLRDWVKKFAEDPEQAFPGHGQMKPEQQLSPDHYIRLAPHGRSIQRYMVTQARKLNRSQQTSVEHRSIDSRDRTVRLREQCYVGRAHR